jgi:hypothetical protein
MRVVIELSTEELKRRLHDYSEGYVSRGPRVGVLTFHEYKYEHPADCKGDHAKLKAEGRPCFVSECKPNSAPTTIKVLQILPDAGHVIYDNGDASA